MLCLKCGVSPADGRTVRHLSLVFCYLLSLAAIFVTCLLCAPFHFPVLFLFKNDVVESVIELSVFHRLLKGEPLQLGAGEKRGNGSNNDIGK